VLTRRRVVLGTIVLALIGWAIAVVVLVSGAVGDLEAGRDAVLDARDGLDLQGIADRRPLPSLQDASAHFADADAAMSNVVLAPIKMIPILGRQVRSAEALSSAASDATSAAAEGMESVGAALAIDSTDGPSRLAQVTALGVAAETAHQRLVAISDLGPSKGLVSPLADARADLSGELQEATDSLADAAAGARAARGLLEGPRRYLVVAANNSEMRAASGMWLSAGVLETSQGSLALQDMTTLTGADMAPAPGSVAVGPLSEDYNGLWSWAKPAQVWHNLMLSPDFPASAELAARMWQSTRGQSVDGVLAIDPFALAAIVRATGPIELDGRVITADQVETELLHDQYLQFGGSSDAVEERRDQLSRLAQAVFDAFQTADWDPSILARELADAVQGRHLMAWSPSEVEAEGWRAAHMDGGLQRSDVAVSLLNTSGTKADWFLRTDVTVDVQSVGQESEVVLRIEVTNEVPDGEPRYVAGPYPGLEDLLAAGDHRAILAVNVPGAARGLGVDGVEQPVVFGDDGPTKVVANEVIVRQGEVGSFVVRFRIPGETGAIRVLPSARSSAMSWNFRQDSWQDTKEHALNW
jgi:hypothetical protein